MPSLSESEMQELSGGNATEAAVCYTAVGKGVIVGSAFGAAGFAAGVAAGLATCASAAA